MSKHTPKWFVILFCVFLSGICGKRIPQKTIDLTEYFSHYPPVKETALITFDQSDVGGILQDGWTHPKKKTSSPFFWTSGTKSILAVLLREKRTYTMRIWCRSKIHQNMEVQVNDVPVSFLDIKKDKTYYSILLPQQNIRSGLNSISFKHSPSKKETLGDTRIAFQQLHFSPIEKGQTPDLRILSSKKAVKLTGPICCSFHVRTYLDSKLRFLHQSAGLLSPEDRIVMSVEGFLGQKRIRDFRLSSTSESAEEIDLSDFPNQAVKITWTHPTKKGTTTTISKPRLENGRYPVQQRKILLFGLDGAAWEIINPMIEAGKLPHFKRLLSQGTSGRLRSVQPMYSPLIWTSMVTGKTKEKHGITGFLDQQKRKGEIIPNSRLNRRCLALWNILSDNGYLVGIVGPWVSWPAETVNGYLITDRVYFDSLSFTTFPLALKHAIHGSVKALVQEDETRYSSMMDALRSIPMPLRSSLLKNIEQEKIYLNQDQLKKTAGLFLNSIFQPDFFFLYMRGPDITSHLFWKYFEPDNSVSPVEEERFSDLIPLNYMYQDHILGEYLNTAGQDATVIVVSDHGMARKSYDPEITFARIDKLLDQVGILENISESQLQHNQIKLTFKNDVSLNRMEKILVKLYLENERTPLFSIRHHEEKHALVLNIHNLNQLNDNLSVFYEGNKLEALNHYITLKDISGAHTLHGILIMKGSGIKQNHQLKECSVLDITPTILHLLDLPVGEDMDGQVLLEAFNAQFRENHPIQSITSYELLSRSERMKPETIERDRQLERQLKDRLRSLGYIK